eukprot:m.15389 g.15389  ORF g.15389 m.15389 type:complete len:457 (+) comp5011_c0_seq1:3746-5116(+)
MSLPDSTESELEDLLQRGHEYRHDAAGIGIFQRAIEIMRANPLVATPPRELEAVGGLAVACRVAGQERRAIRLGETAVALARELDDEYELCSALYNLGLALYARGRPAYCSAEYSEVVAGRADIDQAVAAWSEVLEYAVAMGDTAFEGRAAGNLGNAYLQLGKIDEAITAQRRRLEIAEQAGDLAAVARACGNLGNALAASDSLGEAISAYEKSKAAAEETGDAMAIAQAAFSLGVAHAKGKNFKEAVRCFHSHLSLVEEMGNVDEQIRAWCNLRSVYQQSGQVAMAEEYDANIARAKNKQKHPKSKRQMQVPKQSSSPSLFKRLLSFRSTSVQALRYSETAAERPLLPPSTAVEDSGEAEACSGLPPATAGTAVPDRVLDLVELVTANRLDEQRAAAPVVDASCHTPLHPLDMPSPLDAVFAKMAESPRLDSQRADKPTSAIDLAAPSSNVHNTD